MMMMTTTTTTTTTTMIMMMNFFSIVIACSPFFLYFIPVTKILAMLLPMYAASTFSSPVLEAGLFLKAEIASMILLKHHTMKRMRVCGDIAPLFIDLDGTQMLASSRVRFTLEESSPDIFWIGSWAGCKKKSVAPAANTMFYTRINI
jgi:hypothetical protein